MSHFDKIKKIGKSLFGKMRKHLAPKEEEAPPSKFHHPRGFTGMDTQKELKDFQHKQQPTKPQAEDVDLSKVLDDVLQKPGASPDQELYSGKKK